MDTDSNKVTWVVVIVAAVAIMGGLFVKFLPDITSQMQVYAQTVTGNLSGVDASSNSEFSYSEPNTANDTISITGFSKGYSGHEENLIIPQYRKIGLVYYKITRISDDAFNGNKSIKHVTIYNDFIGGGAFYDDSNLKSLTLGSGVKLIGHWAFWDTALTRVDFPASVTLIDTWAFHGAPISAISFKSPVELNWGVFSDTKLTNVTLPTGSTYKDQTTYDPSKFGQDAGFPTFDSNVTVTVK